MHMAGMDAEKVMCSLLVRMLLLADIERSTLMCHKIPSIADWLVQSGSVASTQLVTLCPSNRLLELCHDLRLAHVCLTQDLVARPRQYNQQALYFPHFQLANTMPQSVADRHMHGCALLHACKRRLCMQVI
jgi:hypothetical protein